MLPKAQRLSSLSFKALRAFITVKGRFFSAKVYRQTKSPRAAVVVSKKVWPSAVGRNRIRRRMYEVIAKLPTHSFTIVVYPTKEVRTAPFSEIEMDMKKVISQVQ